MDKLNNFINLKNGKTSPDRITKGQYPVFGANGIIGYSNEFNAPPRTIIIGRVGEYCGSVHFSEKESWVTDNAIIANSKTLGDEKFWFYFLKSYDLNRLKIGSGQPLINQSILKSIEFQYDIDLSARIEFASKLSIFDQKIALNTQTNQTLEAIAQAIFKHWFIDFAPVHAKAEVLAAGGSAEDAELAAMASLSGKTPDAITALAQSNPDAYQTLRQTAVAFPSSFTDSELGLVPEGWEVKQVGDIVERLSNKRKLTKKDILDFGNVPIFEQGRNTVIGFHNDTPDFLATPQNPIFIFGDHTCVMHISTQPFSIYQNVIPLKGKFDLPTLWVYLAIKDKQEFQEYRRHWMELIVKNVCLPNSMLLIELFSKLVSPLFEMRDFSFSQNQTLSQARDALLPKLLNGEIEL